MTKSVSRSLSAYDLLKFHSVLYLYLHTCEQLLLMHLSVLTPAVMILVIPQYFVSFYCLQFCVSLPILLQN